MDADEPEILRKRDAPRVRPDPEVGEFRQGSAASQWGLARYLVGRAITESVGTALLIVAGVLVVLTVVSSWVVHSTFLAVIFVLLAVGVLLLRWIMLGIVRRLTGFRQSGPLAERMRSLVDDTRPDVLRELRRIGLPGRTWTLPLLAFRFFRRERRKDAMTRLRTFEIERAVPKARLDEMHLLLRQTFSGGVPPEPGWQTGRHD
jgi:hypothetical protein